MGRAAVIPELRDGELGWQARAACRDSDLHLEGDAESILAALVMCTHCPVLEECSSWAVSWTWAGAVVAGIRYDLFGHKSELRSCSAAGCNELFVASRPTSIMCSTSCRNRARWAAAAIERRMLASA